MKKNIITATLAVAVLTSLTLTSCKKHEVTPNETKTTTNAGSQSNANIKTMAPVFYSGILSNNGYPSDGQTLRGYFSNNAFFGQSAPTTLTTFGGSMISTVKCFAATKAFQAFVYKSLDNYMHLNSGATALDGSYSGTDNIILLNGATLFTLAIEEIEVFPGTTDVYALARNGNAIQLYKIDAAGTATIMTYNGSTTVYNNPLGNGYKSGSICFVPKATSPGGYQLVFTNESTVYSSLGLVSWHYNVVGSTVVAVPADHRTYSTATSGIPGAQTGKINTAYSTHTSTFYFARDNSNLYKLNLTASNTAATQLTTTPMINSNDFGYWYNF